MTTEDIINAIKNNEFSPLGRKILIEKLQAAEELASYCRGYDFSLPNMRGLLKYVKAFDKVGRNEPEQEEEEI